MKRTVYHTVKYTSDKDRIIKEAPFYCREKTSGLKEWLGEGYYFWETFEALAHWWGKVRYRSRNLHYVICSTDFECEEDDMLDLVGNTEQMRDIQEIVDVMRKIPEYKATSFTAQFVVNFIRTKTPFDFKAVRAYGINCSSDKLINQYQFPFSSKSYMHICPEIQICVIDKSVLKLPVEITYCSADYSYDSLTV